MRSRDTVTGFISEMILILAVYAIFRIVFDAPMWGGAAVAFNLASIWELDRRLP